MSDRFNAWLIQHPVIMWSVNHPIISLVGGSIAIILILRLLATIYRAIANTTRSNVAGSIAIALFTTEAYFRWKSKTRHGCF